MTGMMGARRLAGKQWPQQVKNEAKANARDENATATYQWPQQANEAKANARDEHVAAIDQWPQHAN